MKAHSAIIILGILFAVSVFVSGCSDPKNYEVTKLTDDQRKELGQKLTADEGQKFTGWTLRHTLTGTAAQPGITVGQALKEQDEWLAKKKVEEANAEELRKKIEAERLVKQEEFKNYSQLC